MSPNRNDHEAGGSSSSKEKPGKGSDHGHDSPSGTGGSRNERDRPGSKAPEPPVDATKPGQTDWRSGSPLRQPETRVSAATRAKHYPDHIFKDPRSKLEQLLDFWMGAWEWGKIIVEKDPYEGLKKAWESAEGNPEWSQPPAAPAERVPHLEGIKRHYENRIKNREIEAHLERHAPPYTGYPLPNIQIKSNSLCLVNPPGDPSSAGIRAARSGSRDSIPETQARAADTIIAGDREMQELLELWREVNEQLDRAQKDLASSRNKGSHLQEKDKRLP